MAPMHWPVLVFMAIVALVGLIFALIFARFFSIWMRALLSGAQVSFPTLILMSMRRSPVEKIINLKIQATQAGLSIPISKIESALLAGADVERAVFALIRAQEVGIDVTWEEVIAKDLSDQLKHDLFPDQA